MSLFADTSVWSLTFRRDKPQTEPEVRVLIDAFHGRDAIYVTGLVLQEVLQGFAGPRSRDQIIERFASLPDLVPQNHDHIEAAELRNRCRRAGVQIETVDALLAQLCIHHDLTMLATDRDFVHIGQHSALKLWKA
ncbi:MAG TPA: PIN domain-containing protein [Rhizomicrobium sp.]|nr:PIN domain-containing protein [Rhizomicrobium sp.]